MTSFNSSISDIGSCVGVGCGSTRKGCGTMRVDLVRIDGAATKGFVKLDKIGGLDENEPFFCPALAARRCRGKCAYGDEKRWWLRPPGEFSGLCARCKMWWWSSALISEPRKGKNNNKKK